MFVIIQQPILEGWNKNAPQNNLHRVINEKWKRDLRNLGIALKDDFDHGHP